MSDNNNSEKKQESKTDQQKQRMTTVWVIIGIIAIVIIALVINWHSNNPAAPTVDTSTLPPATNVENAQDSSSTDMGYNDALKAYTGKEVTITMSGSTCVLTPGAQSLKAGTRVLFDNEASAPVTLTFQGESFVVDGHHYSTKALLFASTSPITCNGVAAGSITITQ